MPLQQKLRALACPTSKPEYTHLEEKTSLPACLKLQLPYYFSYKYHQQPDLADTLYRPVPINPQHMVLFGEKET